MAQFSYEPEWRSRNVSERLAHAYGNGLFVDKFFISFLNRRYPIKAHKNVLAHVSQVFEEHFYGHEKDSNCLSGIHPHGLSYVLKLLYKLPFTLEYGDRTVILFAYHVARTLRILHIENQIKDEILGYAIGQSTLTAEDFWKFLELSRVLKLKDVKEVLLEFAAINTSEVLNATSLEVASASTMKEVLDLDKLNTVEIDVLANAVRWYNGNSSEPFARDFFKDLLSCVRFRNIPLKDFVTFIKGNWGIMTGKDVMRISMHLERPTLYSLPPWCSSKFRLPCSLTTLSSFKEHHEEKCPENFSDAFLDNKQADPIKLLDMYTKGRFTDVCFLVGSQQRRIKAHRNILALGSPVFEKMFFGQLADSRYKIEINTENPDGFEAMIRFFYDDSRPDDLFNSPDIASMTLDVALKYGSEKLRTLCSSYAESETLKLRMFWKHLEYRMDLGSEGENGSILKQFPKFAESNAADIFKHFTFLSAAKEAIIFVLQLDSLNIKEIDILEHIAQWIEYNFLCFSEYIKYELLSHIRFTDISPSEFLTFLKRHPDIFNSEESFQILFYLNDKSGEIPEWCYRGPSRRLNQPSHTKDTLAERGKSTNALNGGLNQPKSASSTSLRLLSRKR